MKIVNILFNFKKNHHDNQILGVERCFIDYAKRLSFEGAEVVSVMKPKMIYGEKVKEASASTLEISASNRIDVFSIFRLALLFFKFKPDVAICHSGRALFFARAARFVIQIINQKKFPIVAIDHGINPIKFIKADYVLTVNSFFREELIKAGKPADQALTIPNMIEAPKDFLPLKKKPFGKTIKLGSLGRIYPEKNFASVLQAMKILRSRGITCEYVIGGVGKEEELLKNLAQKLNLVNYFKILGWVNDKRKFFEEIDIFILPSFHETFGIVLLEAMLYSTPIITTNSWGPNEVIEDEVDGLKVSRDNAKEMPKLLADAIERLIKDEDFAKKLAQKAQEKFFNKYSAEVVGKKLYDLCQKFCDDFKNYHKTKIFSHF